MQLAEVVAGWVRDVVVVEAVAAGSACGGPEAQPGMVVACILQNVMAGRVAEGKVVEDAAADVEGADCGGLDKMSSGPGIAAENSNHPVAGANEQVGTLSASTGSMAVYQAASYAAVGRVAEEPA